MYFIDAPLAFINCQECDPIFSTDLRTTCLDGTLGTIQFFFFFNETFQLNSRTMKKFLCCCTAFSSEIGTKLRESAVGQAGGSCYSRAALSSNVSKTLYYVNATCVTLTAGHCIGWHCKNTLQYCDLVSGEKTHTVTPSGQYKEEYFIVAVL